MAKLYRVDRKNICIFAGVDWGGGGGAMGRANRIYFKMFHRS